MRKAKLIKQCLALGLAAVIAAETPFTILASEEASVSIDVNGFYFTEGKARILTSPSVHDHNDFDNPEKVVIKDHEIKIDGKYVNITLPPFSVAAVTLK